MSTRQKLLAVTIGIMFCMGSMSCRGEGPEAFTRIRLWQSGPTNLQGWKDAKGLQARNDAGILCLNVTASDAWLIRGGLAIDPKTVGVLCIRYRARGFTGGPTSGQFYYGNSRHGFQHTNHVPLPALMPDGNWHDLVILLCSSDWDEGGTVSRIRLDMVDQFPGTIEVKAIELFSHAAFLRNSRITDTTQVDTGAAKAYLLGLDSFLKTEAGTFERSLILPNEQYGVWARIRRMPQAQQLLHGLVLKGGTLAPAAGPVADTDPDQWAWVRVGTTPGGTLTVRLPDTDNELLDAVLIVAGAAVPADRPPRKESPVRSAIQPITPPVCSILRPYWRGGMLCHPLAPNRKGRTFFRRTVLIPESVSNAWLQMTVDDAYRTYLNGTLLKENTEAESWRTPAVLDITDRLRHGQTNTFAIECINHGGPAGLLFDLTLNHSDGSFSKFISDADWRCAINAADGWIKPGFDDSAWVPPEVQAGPPNAPWNVEIPYEDKTGQIPTECLSITNREMISGGGTQEMTIVFRSSKPVLPGEVMRVTLTDEKTKIKLEKEFALKEAQCRTEGNTTTVSGIAFPISRWYPSMDLRIDLTVYGRRLSGLEDRPPRFRYENPVKPGTLRSEVRTVAGTPQLFVNDRAIYPMFGNAVAMKSSILDTLVAADFNIFMWWTDHADPAQLWWRGPGEYDFRFIDKKIIDLLEAKPDALIYPTVWCAPPPWWGKQYPDELALFNDGRPWSYYRATHSLASERWRQDIAVALEAFVKHIESSPYAERVVGYHLAGGLSSEWQYWGCQQAGPEGRMMDYSKPALEGFRKFLQKQNMTAAGVDIGKVAVPTVEERLRAGIGLFRDPAKDGFAIAYDQFISQMNTAGLLHCAETVKRASGGRKVVGTYYGYTLEYTGMGWTLHTAGHNALRMALNSPYLDMFTAPPSYRVRAVGEDQAWMWPFAAIQQAGKIVWVDDDTRTYLSGPCGYNPAVNPEMTRAVLRRNFGKALCRLCPQGFLPLTSGLELADASIQRDLRVIRRAGEYAVAQAVERHAEIAVVVDEESVPYLVPNRNVLPTGETERVIHWNGKVERRNKMANPLLGELVSLQRGRIARIGAPVDYLLLSDLLLKPRDYKLFVMLSCFRADDKLLKTVHEKLYARGATVLWCYAPGFIREGTAGEENIIALTGIRLTRLQAETTAQVVLTDVTSPWTCGNPRNTTFGVPYPLNPLFQVTDPEARALGVYTHNGKTALAAKTVSGGTSIFCGVNKLSVDLLRGVAAGAGVHLYSDSHDPLDANDHFVMLHTSTAGDKTILLPKSADVVDVFSGETLFRKVQTFTITLPGEETRLFFIGDSKAFTAFMDYDRLNAPHGERSGKGL